MRHEHRSSSPVGFELALRALLALEIADGGERRHTTAPRIETILARAGLTDADIASVTGGDPAAVRAILTRDRPVSVIERARAHMVRNAT
jgi:hypothetical protein